MISSTSPAKKTPIGRVLFGIVILFGLIAIGRQAGEYLPTFTNWIDTSGAWAPLLFILGYAAATVAFVPGSVLTLAAGALFGITNGTFIVFIGASAGAALAFLVARYIARKTIEQRLQDNHRFKVIDKAIARDGLKIVFLLRLSPVFPFNLLNYALGLTAIRFRDYCIASIGMIPASLLYVYYGKVAGDLARLAAGQDSVQGTAYYGILGIGLIATIAVTAFVTRIARRALENVTENQA